MEAGHLLALVISLGIGCMLCSVALALNWMARRLPAVERGTVAFFHPFSDGGGGGERVLWCAVKAVQEASPRCKVVIYAREGLTPERLVQEASLRFNISIPKPIQVVGLRKTHLILPERYPRFTLIRQALGSIVLTYEALQQLVPEVFVDTTGWAFGYPLAWQAGARVACYVHYPTISSDMLLRVWRGTTTYNNQSDIAESPLKTVAKFLYYHCVALLYSCCGFFSSVTMVNSSWTRAHIARIWFASRAPTLVYPPCDTLELQQLPLDRKLKHLFLVSVNQFRPEKDHRLQLEAFALAKRMAGGDTAGGAAVREATLKLVGGVRNKDDEARLAALQQYAEELGIADCCEWLVNAPYGQLKALLGGAVGGLHTMADEHFGISVVEYMAAGVIPIAHNSAGPKEDIVVPVVGEDGEEQATGFLASSVEEYAEAITKVLAMDQRERLKITAAAQKRASRFSTERFLEDFSTAMAPLLPTA